ncbi:hypothetical protein CPC08DRAFT_763298 [Agrocybe pediades]|nr:hypothetical protein CPC08DRAFT_763298 [Agrocybe pediades]
MSKPNQQKNKGKAKEKQKRGKRAEDNLVILPNAANGYAAAVSEDGVEYLVPRYMLEDAKCQASGHRKRLEALRERVEIGTGVPEDGETDRFAEGMLTFPPNPMLSQFDLLQRHAEVMAMRDMYGITYKDACHRLYLAELERVKAKLETYFAMKELELSIIDALEEVSQTSNPDHHLIGDPNKNYYGGDSNEEKLGGDK